MALWICNRFILPLDLNWVHDDRIWWIWCQWSIRYILGNRLFLGMAGLDIAIGRGGPNWPDKGVGPVDSQKWWPGRATRLSVAQYCWLWLCGGPTESRATNSSFLLARRASTLKRSMSSPECIYLSLAGRMCILLTIPPVYVIPTIWFVIFKPTIRHYSGIGVTLHVYHNARLT